MKSIALAAAATFSFTALASDPPTGREVDAVLARVGAGFDRGDGDAVAANWTEDGTLIDPMGVVASGRETVARIATFDGAMLFRGTRSTFTRDSLRPLGDSAVLVDATHAVTGATTMQLHVVFLMVKVNGAWRIADARPYTFMPPSAARSDARAQR
jgi:uncharacterized protein (TIGR02246 family)